MLKWEVFVKCLKFVRACLMRVEVIEFWHIIDLSSGSVERKAVVLREMRIL